MGSFGSSGQTPRYPKGYAERYALAYAKRYPLGRRHAFIPHSLGYYREDGTRAGMGGKYCNIS